MIVRFWRAFTGWVTSQIRQFNSESRPMPIDQLWRELKYASGTVSREEALSVPAVLRGRNLICSIATLPLVVDGPDRKPVDNPLLRQIDPHVTNISTLTDTVDDLLFYGRSVWRITARDFNGFPTSAEHVAYGAVSNQPPIGHTPAPLPSGDDPRAGARWWIDGVETDASELIIFQSPNPGLLKAAGRAINRAIMLDKAAATHADEPAMRGFFTSADPQVDPFDTDEEMFGFLRKFKRSRKEFGTGYLGVAVKYNEIVNPTPADIQLVQLQQQVWLELANALGIDPEDLGISTTSRTYQNAVDRRKDRINDMQMPYMQAVTQTLSMHNVTRHGHVVRFDTDDYLRADPKTRWEVYEIQLRMGATTVEEIRREENMPPLPGGIARPAIRVQATVDEPQRAIGAE